MAAGRFSVNSRSTDGSSSVTLDELVQAVSDDVGYHWKSLTDTLGLDSRKDVQKIQHECTRQEGGTGDLQKRCANHMFAIWKSRVLSSGVPESDAKKQLLFALEGVPALEHLAERVRGLIGEQEDPRQTTVSSDPLVESGVYSIQGSELLSAPNESSGLQFSSMNPSSEEPTVPSPPQTLNSFSTKSHSETSTARTSTVPSISSEMTAITSTESSWPTIATTGPITTSTTQSTTQPATANFVSLTSSSTTTVHPSFSPSQTEYASEIATSLPGQQHPTRISQMNATVPPLQVVNKPRRNSSENKYSSRMIAPNQVSTTTHSSQSTPAGSDSYMQGQGQARIPPYPSAGRPHSQGRGPFNAQVTPIAATGKIQVSNSNHPSPSNTTQAFGLTPPSGPAHATLLPAQQQSMGNPLPTPALQRGLTPHLVSGTIQSSPIVAYYEPTTNDGPSYSRAYVSREPQRSQQTRSADVHYQPQPPSTGIPYQSSNYLQWDGQHREETLSIRGQNLCQPSDQNHQNHGQYRTIGYDEAQAEYHHHGQQRKQQQLDPGLKEGQYQQEQQQQQQYSSLNLGMYQQQQQQQHQEPYQQQEYLSLHLGQYQQQQQQHQQQYQGSKPGPYQQQQQQHQRQYWGYNPGQYHQQQHQPQYLGFNQGQYHQDQGLNQLQYQQQQNEQQYADYNWGRLQNQRLQQQKHQLSTNPAQVNSQLNPHLDPPGPSVAVPSSSTGVGPTRVNNCSNSYSTQSGDSGHEELPVSGVLKLTNRSSLFLILDLCLRLRRRKMLGMALKLELSDIDAIIREENEPEEQTFQIIKRWIVTRGSGGGATLDVLLQAMELIQETACVELIKGACMKESQHRYHNANISD